MYDGGLQGSHWHQGPEINDPVMREPLRTCSPVLGAKGCHWGWLLHMGWRTIWPWTWSRGWGRRLWTAASASSWYLLLLLSCREGGGGVRGANRRLPLCAIPVSHAPCDLWLLCRR